MRFKTNTYNDKKDGFSLIELLAVLGITLILFTMILPKVSNSVETAKEVKALDDVRQVVLAIEDYNILASSVINDEAKYSSICSKIDGKMIDVSCIKTIESNMTYKDMKEVLNGKKTFKMKDGKIHIT